MADITKREAWGGGIIAAALAVAVPIVQAWAEGQRKDAGDKAAGAEIAWFVPIVQGQFEHAKRLEAQVLRLEQRLEQCQDRARRR